MFWVPPKAITLVAAELMALLTRSTDVTILFKSSSERGDAENERVRRGLRKELLLDFILYVPASVALILLTIRLMLPVDFMAKAYSHAVLGTIAYAFPYAVFKNVVLKLVFRSLSAAIPVLSEHERVELLKQIEKPTGQNRRARGTGGTGGQA
jgi:hypothetical protein